MPTGSTAQEQKSFQIISTHYEGKTSTSLTHLNSFSAVALLTFDAVPCICFILQHRVLSRGLFTEMCKIYKKKPTTINISCLTYLSHPGDSGLKWEFSKMLHVGHTGLLEPVVKC